MTAPTYKGTGQPTASSGWLAGLGSWFGASAPVYDSAPKPAAVSTPTTQAVVGTCDPDRITLVIPRDLIDSQQLVASASQDGDVSSCDAERITLVIPRSLIQSQQ